jgi:hypothetical protein
MARQVEIDDIWVRRVNSPLFWVVSACTGVSMSFCLLFINQNDQAGYSIFHPYNLMNMAVIWFVFWFYTGIAGPVIKQIRTPHAQDSHDGSAVTSG